MAKEVPLTQDKVALVDDDDYPVVSRYKWHAMHCYEHLWYAATGHNTYLHRFILNPPRGYTVDHINGNGLDCRKENMRICKLSDNVKNRHCYAGQPIKEKGRRPHRLNRNNRSGFLGVCHHPLSNKWRAQIIINGKYKHLGFFDVPQQAAEAYDQAALKHYGESARTNKSIRMRALDAAAGQEATASA